MKIEKIKLINGQELRDYEINEEAVPLPGYIPVKAVDGEQTAYINSGNVLYMVVGKDGADNAYIHTAPFPVRVAK